ncbi:MAG: hypothetical protein DHS20C18_03170 [Saprospiraceae bacterium]|nr:MAG: hypothetical protein DHS20C18_03170 [Saprospiraceae bacterium]
METPLYTFTASISADQITFWTAFIIALAALVGLIFLIRRKVEREAYNRNALLSMLTFFAFLIAASTAFFSSWSMKKTGPVSIYSDRIELPSGTVQFEEMKKAYLKREIKRSVIDPKKSSKEVSLLLIEENTGKLHVLSELNYPVSEILNKLKEAQKE